MSRRQPARPPVQIGATLVAAWLVAACGSRTPLNVPPEPSPDGGRDANGAVDASGGAGPDARDDASEPARDAGPEAGECDEGLNTMYPTVGGSAPADVWFASPYTPGADISVERIETHTLSGSVALLASTGGAPGTVLFSGTVGTSATPAWLGASVNPPIYLHGGELYYLAFQDEYCSWAMGPELVEYFASSLSGPWAVDGTDVWTARLIGPCSTPP